MPRVFEDLSGKQFERLNVIEFSHMYKNVQRVWKCICSCKDKNMVYVTTGHLMSGHTRSCGCIHDERFYKHGFIYGSKLQRKFYRAYNNMISRCSNPNSPQYKDWGGRGVKVCDRWLGEHGFENFRDDMWESFIKHVKEFGEKETTLDRWPNKHGNYELENLRWASYHEQSLNTRLASETLDRDLWKVFHNLGLSINVAIVYYGYSRYESLLRCTLKEAREHIESQFKDGMSWDNYGEWQIDHIKSLRLFDFSKEDDIMVAFHYTNLQPMWKPENDRKK